jgi:hypothetical protein
LIFTGLRADVAVRQPHYLSDFTDAAHRKVVSSTFYLFFACLANAIAFGALSGLLTRGEIGTIEMIVATAIGGISYALVSAQPITLLGGTGPIVIFTALLYQACALLGVPFITTYAWVGIWAGVILLVLSVTNASNWMRYFSRFTDDIFAALVSIIFIVEAVRNLWAGISEQGQAFDTRAMIAVLAIGTFVIAICFTMVSRSERHRGSTLAKVSDFGPSIAIVAMTVIAFSTPGIVVQGPVLPESFEATTSGRPWTVDIFSAEPWVILAGAVPALFAAILLYLDQNITSRIINESGEALEKGKGYHLDLMIVGALTFGFSLFGMPWIVAATVHSVNHLKGLSGAREVAGKLKNYVIENRVSALVIHVLIAVSIFFLDLVALIPVPVLFGLFVYMGYVSLRGNDFAARAAQSLRLVIRAGSIGPEAVENASERRYTILQTGAFVVLWVVKSSAIGILFPIFIALCVPYRIWIGRWFRREELTVLDDFDPTRPL